MKFSNYLNNRIDEKLGNLNASSNIKYRLLLSAILKNKYWRGLNGPNSPVVEVSGKGRTQLIKDLNKLVPKFGIPQTLFLTTGEDSHSVKSNMIRFDTPTIEDAKVGLNSPTFDVGIKRKYDESAGTDINVVDVERSVASANGKNRIPKRLKYSLDDVDLDDNNTYKAIVIFSDPDNIDKDYNRTQNKYSNDKYIRDPFNGKTGFMLSAELKAERLKTVKHRIFKTSSMTMKDAHRMLALTGDDADNIIIDGEMYIKNYNMLKDTKIFINTQTGIMYLCQLIPHVNNKKWQKNVVLTYNMKSDKFELDEDNFNFNFYD